MNGTKSRRETALAVGMASVRRVVCRAASVLLVLVCLALATVHVLIADAKELESASATTSNCSYGHVVVLTKGQKGENTHQQSITGSNSPPIASGVTSATLTPGFEAGQCFCRIVSPQGNDGHAIKCSAKDAGKSELVVALEVSFAADLDETYEITWENENFAVSWEGFIRLPETYGTCDAKFQAFTRRPFASGSPAPTHVAVPVNGAGQPPYWEHSKTAPSVYQINDDSGQVPLSNQAETFDVVATSANTTSGVMSHEVFTTLEVELTKSVACENNSGDVTYEVQTNQWEVYGWEISVSVTGP